MATFSVTPLSSQIRVGTEFKSAYQWAAKLAPAAKPENRATGTPAVKDRLIEYKNAMLWLEGEDFASVEAESSVRSLDHGPTGEGNCRSLCR